MKTPHKVLLVAYVVVLAKVKSSRGVTCVLTSAFYWTEAMDFFCKHVAVTHTRALSQYIYTCVCVCLYVCGVCACVCIWIDK